MILVFNDELEFTTWLGESTLPSKIIATILDTQEYVCTSNNSNEFKTWRGTIEDMREASDLPASKMIEMEVDYRSRYDVVPDTPANGLESRVQALESAIENIPQFDPSDLENRISNVETSIENIPQFDPSALESRIAEVESTVSGVDEKVGVVDEMLDGIIGE